MKKVILTFVSVVCLTMVAPVVYAGLLKINGAEGKPCTVKMVRGKGNTICNKLPAGCGIENKEYDTGEAAISQIELGHKVLVDVGDFVFCGIDDFYGTTNGAIIRDEETGVQYNFDSESQKFNKVITVDTKKKKRGSTRGDQR
jgi:hypothetical protein